LDGSVGRGVARVRVGEPGPSAAREHHDGAQRDTPCPPKAAPPSRTLQSPDRISVFIDPRQIPIRRYCLYDIICNMKTVAVTLDAATLAALDRLTSEPARRSRSAVVRQAVLALSERTLTMEREDREAKILRVHRAKLGRQAKALIREQAGS
ncbi:MAG TPA: hypothetical protein VKO16_03920, partial [Polyangia bacterium]|nr:hypothetical protein [Polyangia bacterium]